MRGGERDARESREAPLAFTPARTRTRTLPLGSGLTDVPLGATASRSLVMYASVCFFRRSLGLFRDIMSTRNVSRPSFFGAEKLRAAGREKQKVWQETYVCVIRMRTIAEAMTQRERRRRPSTRGRFGIANKLERQPCASGSTYPAFRRPTDPA